MPFVLIDTTGLGISTPVPFLAEIIVKTMVLVVLFNWLMMPFGEVKLPLLLVAAPPSTDTVNDKNELFPVPSIHTIKSKFPLSQVPVFCIVKGPNPAGRTTVAFLPMLIDPLGSDELLEPAL